MDTARAWRSFSERCEQAPAEEDFLLETDRWVESVKRWGETMSSRRACFYCDGLVSAKGGAGDHMPLPARNGGIETVPCCLSCHDMKDRFPIDQWPRVWVAKVMEDFPRLSRETRIFLAKALSAFSDVTKGPA